MALSITSVSQSDFVALTADIPRGKATLTLNFESEVEAQWARYFLYTEKFHPEVFRVFPDFQQYDPTLSLPSGVREKAIRLFPRSLAPQTEDDVTGMVSSIYSEDGKLIGSLISAAYEVPAVHALCLHQFLSLSKLKIKISYDSAKERVLVHIPHAGHELGFWFPADRKQIQVHDLQETLANNGYLGMTFPIATKTYDLFISRKMGGTRAEITDEFFSKQILNDWLTFHLSGDKVVRQSAKLSGNILKQPWKNSPLDQAMTPKEWLVAAP